MTSPRKSRITLCIAFALSVLTCAASVLAVEPALLSRTEGGNVGVLMSNPALPNPVQTLFTLPVGAVPHEHRGQLAESALHHGRLHHAVPAHRAVGQHVPAHA